MVAKIYKSRILKLLILYTWSVSATREGIYCSDWGIKMFGLATGEYLGQRRPYSEQALIVLVNKYRRLWLQSCSSFSFEFL